MCSSTLLPAAVLVGIALGLLTSACGDEITRQGADVTHINGVQSALAQTASDAVATTTSGSDTTSDTGSPPDTTADTGSDTTGDTAPDTADTADTTDTNPPGPTLIVPNRIALPHIDAGAGSVSAQIVLSNSGAASSLSLSMSGAASLAASGPATIDAQATITVSFTGSANPAIAHGTLTITAGEVHYDVPVYAVAGDPSIAKPGWDPLSRHDLTYGHGLKVGMPTAPFPSPGASWTDDSVLVFVPDGFRDRGVTDFVVHFHGFRTEIDETVAAHLYREQLYLSGSNAVLVIPQGPVEASSGDFGKLMEPGGLALLLEDVISVLYRDGWVDHPVRGDVTLTAHSGGYQAVADNLDTVTDGGLVTHVALLDALYARESDFESFVGSGGFLRSNYTANGGTRDDNEASRARLGGDATAVASQATLRDAAAVMWFVETSHNSAPSYENAYSEILRWAGGRSRGGPRLALQETSATATRMTARWFSPDDDDVEGFRIETSPNGTNWSLAATTGPNASSATWNETAARQVRVSAVTAGVATPAVQWSDIGYAAPNNDVVVVDGFDRRLDGSFAAMTHNFAALVGAAAGGAAMLSNEAITEAGTALSGWSVAIWLLGDESTTTHTFTTAEQAAVEAFLDAGGAVIVSGSEVGWDLGAQGNGIAFLAELGAAYQADNSRSYTVGGTGPLSGLGSMGYGGVGAAYEEDFPDVLRATGGGEVLLTYGDGRPAAVGIAGRAAVLGFPLELVNTASDRAALVAALINYVRP
ncbi:MAG: hypothetical protein ACI9MR_000476 [Myxococcota bacterium]|jgi:hypothetical protein